MQSEQFRLNAEWELSHWWFVGRRTIVRRLIEEILPPQQGHRIVDVGCGTGGNIANLSSHYQCTGIDPSEDAIRWAQKRFPDTEFRQGHAPQDCKVRLQEAALVTMNDVLEHVADDFRLFTEVLAHTRPGCLFVLTVPAEPALWSMHDESHRHYRRYTLDRFCQLWSGLPVETILVSPFNTRLYPIIRVARWLGSLRKQSFGAHQTDLRLPAPWQNKLLTSIFSGEQHRLLKLLCGAAKPYRCGVSLLAILRGNEGTITPYNRPSDVLADPTPRWLQEQLHG